jgi:DNA-binding NarL/FixJ family response regulator
MVQSAHQGTYRIRVVVVDDHHLLRQSLAALLRTRDDVEVVGEFSNGREAVAGVQDLHPDVILMDAAMPQLNGFDATALIRRDLPGAKVIIVSSYVDADQLRTAMRAGASGYVSKLSEIDELMLAIRSVHRGNTYYSADIHEQLDAARIAVASRSASEQMPGVDLTVREREVLQLLAEGRTTRQIADELVISPKTVEGHKTRIMGKTKARNKSDLIRYALRARITGDERPGSLTSSA